MLATVATCNGRGVYTALHPEGRTITGRSRVGARPTAAWIGHFEGAVPTGPSTAGSH